MKNKSIKGIFKKAALTVAAFGILINSAAAKDNTVVSELKNNKAKVSDINTNPNAEIKGLNGLSTHPDDTENNTLPPEDRRTIKGLIGKKVSDDTPKNNNSTPNMN